MKKIIDKIKILIKEINTFGQLCKSNHLDSHSAAAAFFMFVSIIPVFILLIAIIPFTPLTDKMILNIVEFLLPNKMDSFAIGVVKQLTERSITAIWISAIAAIWSASRSIVTIKQGLNEIRGENDTRNFVIVRINGAFYVVILIVSFVLLLVINVIFTGIDRYFREVLEISISAKYDLVYIIMQLRPLITIIVGFLLNLYIFTFLPNDKIKIKSQIPGAVIVALLWYVFTTLFGIYINYFNAYSMYGSLSIVIIVLFWLYACMYILFLGGQFNYYLSLRRENDTI